MKRDAIALACFAASAVALILALAGVQLRPGAAAPQAVILVDQSASMPTQATQSAVAEVARSARANNFALQWIGFARAPSLPAAAPPGQGDAKDPQSTHIESALDAALALHAQSPLASAVLISDGHQTAGDAKSALERARSANLPVRWMAVGQPPKPVRIGDVLAPDRAGVGRLVQVTTHLVGEAAASAVDSLRVTVRARGSDGAIEQAVADIDRRGMATTAVRARAPGPMLVEVVLEDAGSGRRVDARAPAALIEVDTGAPILLARGSPSPLAESLIAGGWKVDVAPPGRLDGLAEALERYQAVILDDISEGDAGAPFWAKLADAVRLRGLGLLVLGGNRSFAMGGYRGSPLEELLPVIAEPGDPARPTGVLFLVDKSGSMGQALAGEADRLTMARRAVAQTARDLGEQDLMGILAFDAEPRSIVPLGPADASRRLLDAGPSWKAAGGTRLAPALASAVAALEAATVARRILVLVTDGFVDTLPGEELRNRLARASIELVVLGVGAEINLDALRALSQVTGDEFLRVNEAAELPGAMRAALQRKRSRIEVGPSEARVVGQLPFALQNLSRWPAVDAYAVTRLKPQAAMAIASAKGDPLIAWHTSGLGRVAVVTPGLGAGAPRWVRWTEWPRLAGGMVNWVAAQAPAGRSAIRVADEPARLRVELDIAKTDGVPSATNPVIRVRNPGGSWATAEPTAPRSSGLLGATIPAAGPGIYEIQVATGEGILQRTHLRRDFQEGDQDGVSDEMGRWREQGLLGRWEEAWPRASPNESPQPTRIDRVLVMLALAAALAGTLTKTNGRRIRSAAR